MNQTRTNTRERMIAATAELLELQGYHATGLNQVMQVSATPKGSLYFHFPGGKEELAAEAIRIAGSEIGVKIAATLSSTESLGEAVSAFALLLAQDLQTSDFRKGCPVATVAMETAATSDRLRQACEQVYASWFALVEARLSESGIEPAAAKSWTTLVWAAVEGALLLSRTYQNTAPLETIAAQLKQLLDQAVKTHG
ncbi:TetR/AcrR family transcriptional regulator [Phormidium tenue FACHB-886]|nr:TetR/AcrR family transcriptional regulator [Phormidium tenue FACHB-886]